jgi:hypothetical protein
MKTTAEVPVANRVSFFAIFTVSAELIVTFGLCGGILTISKTLLCFVAFDIWNHVLGNRVVRETASERLYRSEIIVSCSLCVSLPFILVDDCWTEGQTHTRSKLCVAWSMPRRFQTSVILTSSGRCEETERGSETGILGIVGMLKWMKLLLPGASLILEIVSSTELDNIMNSVLVPSKFSGDKDWRGASEAVYGENGSGHSSFALYIII